MKTLTFLSGRAALQRRDSLEAAFTRRFPLFLQPIISLMLTWITGLAPSRTGGIPPQPGSAPRAFATTLLAILLGVASILGGLVPLLGALALLLGLRSFSSAIGHHITHGAKVLPLKSQQIRWIYDLISAAFLLSSFEDYRRDHQQHHAYVASPQDPDRRFIAFLGVSFQNPASFFVTLLDPVFHFRFALTRLRANFAERPLRAAYALAVQLSIFAFAPWTAIAAYYAIVIVAFQAATLLQWSTEHLWDHHPQNATPQQIALAVTYGRLLLPDPQQPGWLLKLAVYAAFRSLLLQGDLPQHLLHHLGKGPFTEAAYVYTRLLLEGEIALRQTAGIRAMFQAAFQSAVGVKPQPPREMPSDQMLSM